MGAKLGETIDGQYIFLHVERFRDTPHGVEKRIKATASGERHVTIGLEKDPGQAGEAEAQYLVKSLSGYDVRVIPVHKDKVTRAKPLSSQAEGGNVLLLEGDWNEAFLAEFENFPPPDTKKKQDDETETAGKDDQVDAGSGAFNFLTGDKVGRALAPSKTEAPKTIAAAYVRSAPEW